MYHLHFSMPFKQQIIAKFLPVKVLTSRNSSSHIDPQIEFQLNPWQVNLIVHYAMAFMKTFGNHTKLRGYKPVYVGQDEEVVSTQKFITPSAPDSDRLLTYTTTLLSYAQCLKQKISVEGRTYVSV